jgi:two-component system cell cycle sensor histidine kinase/response regulator CckA
MKTLDEVGHSPMPRGSKGSSILVVDDEAAVRRFAMRVLEREGFGVIEAVDGLEALELVRDKKIAVDAVVSDIVMPRMNGVELLDALSTSHPTIPVLLMSGYATAALSEMGIASPCGILPKPFPPERLLAELERCLTPRNDGSSAA